MDYLPRIKPYFGINKAGLQILVMQDVVPYDFSLEKVVEVISCGPDDNSNRVPFCV